MVTRLPTLAPCQWLRNLASYPAYGLLRVAYCVCLLRPRNTQHATRLRIRATRWRVRPIAPSRRCAQAVEERVDAAKGGPANPLANRAADHAAEHGADKGADY